MLPAANHSGVAGRCRNSRLLLLLPAPPTISLSVPFHHTPPHPSILRTPPHPSILRPRHTRRPACASRPCRRLLRHLCRHCTGRCPRPRALRAAWLSVGPRCRHVSSSRRRRGRGRAGRAPGHRHPPAVSPAGGGGGEGGLPRDPGLPPPHPLPHLLSCTPRRGPCGAPAWVPAKGACLPAWPYCHHLPRMQPCWLCGAPLGVTAVMFHPRSLNPAATAFAAASLQLLVSFILHRILAEHRSWRYARRAERWRLAATALRVVRHALLAAPSLPGGAHGGQGPGGYPGGGGVAAAAASVLRLEVGMASCLLTALPPHASVLEVSHLSVPAPDLQPVLQALQALLLVALGSSNLSGCMDASQDRSCVPGLCWMQLSWHTPVAAIWPPHGSSAFLTAPAVTPPPLVSSPLPAAHEPAPAPAER